MDVSPKNLCMIILSKKQPLWTKLAKFKSKRDTFNNMYRIFTVDKHDNTNTYILIEFHRIISTRHVGVYNFH